MSGHKHGTRRSKPAVAKRPTLKHGGKKVEIPVLTGPVGPSVPELAAKYRIWNAPNDVRVVEYYFSLLAHINHLDTQCGLVDKSGPDLEKSQTAVACWNLNLNQAIRNSQKMCALEIHNPDELKNGIILPDGPTLVQLVDLGDCVEQLEELENTKTNPQKYIYHGLIDANKFIELYTNDPVIKNAEGSAHAKHVVQLRHFLGFLGSDPFMIDIRWMAYILATVLIECAFQWHPVVEKLDKNRKKHQDHYAPVKVKKLDNGTARVTEMDGDQWLVDHNGRNKPLAPKSHAVLGAPRDSAPSAIYKNDDGVANTYVGRGYAQITWWSNYALTGAQINQGLSLLFEPEKALDPRIAYTIISYCLRTGNGFANHHKLSDYIYGSKCEFKGARWMVNSQNKAKDIADIAEAFLRILNNVINSKRK